MLNKINLKCVLIDLDDTLLATSWRLHPAFMISACRALQSECNALSTIKALHAVKKAKVSPREASLNHERFVLAFAKAAGFSVARCERLFSERLPQILQTCERFFRPIDAAQEFLRAIGHRFQIVLATNPMLTQACTHLRIKWAGFNFSDFKFVTHSQNMHSCKPSSSYYAEIIHRLKADGISSEECIFIGNDLKNDGAAIYSGLATILVTKQNRPNTFKVLKKESLRHAALYQASWDSIAQHFGVSR